jgi:tRNA A-37 threonylcarbamoyl transferase component Bud32
MKFGKRLVRQAHSDWVSFYLDYKELKTKLKYSLSNGDFEGISWGNGLQEELEKVNKFFVEKETLLVRQFSQLEQLEETPSEGFAASSSFAHYCRTLELLRYYVVLNYMAIYKITKKRNKTLVSSKPIDFLSILLDQPFYKSIKLARLTVKTELLAIKFLPGEINEKNFSCPVCLDVLCNPVVLSCTHRFCWSCLSKTATCLQACPVCRKNQHLDPKNFTIDWILRDFLHQQFPNSQVKQQQSEVATGLIKQLERRASSLDSTSPIEAEKPTETPKPVNTGNNNKLAECKYTVVGKLGVGVFGEVYLANSKLDPNGPQVALKKLSKSHPKFKAAAVTKEINAGQHLNHESIIKYVDTFETLSSVYLVLEYFKGKDLFSIMEDRQYKPFVESTAKNLFLQLASAIAHCHNQGIAHRDVKLENILMNGEGKIRLIDFGLCDFVMDSTHSNYKQRMCVDSVGSPAYIAPEILTGRPYDGFKSDVWSCGVVLYALLFGRFPYSPSQYKRLVVGEKLVFDYPSCGPASVKNLLHGMLSLDPSLRMSMEEVLRNEWLQESIQLVKVKPINLLVETC